MADRDPSIHDIDERDRFAVAVRLVVFAIQHGELCVVLVQHAPYKDPPALPCGYLRKGEDLHQAARSLADALRLGEGHDGYLEQIGSYAASEDDLRQRALTVAYFTVASDLPQDWNAGGAGWGSLLPIGTLGQRPLKPTHQRIIDDGLERVRSLLEYTTFASRFLRPEFTVSELRQVYELVWGVEVDSGNFRRNIDRCGGFVCLDTSEQSHARPPRWHKRGRPASLWSARDAGRPGRPDALLARALASRDRGGSLLGIRTRSAMAPSAPKPSESDPSRTAFIGRNRLTYLRLSAGSYDVVVQESGKPIGRVEKQKDGAWSVSSLEGRHPPFETRSDAAFYLWALQNQPTAH